MKKIRNTLLAAIIVVMAVSCGKSENRVDSIGYNYGSLQTDVYIDEEDAYIDSVYAVFFREIPDATVTDTYVYLYGRYGDMDKLVLDACAKAEQELADVQFLGWYDFIIHACYVTDVKTFFYEKVYGNRLTDNQ